MVDPLHACDVQTQLRLLSSSYIVIKSGFFFFNDGDGADVIKKF